MHLKENAWRGCSISTIWKWEKPNDDHCRWWSKSSTKSGAHDDASCDGCQLFIAAQRIEHTHQPSCDHREVNTNMSIIHDYFMFFIWVCVYRAGRVLETRKTFWNDNQGQWNMIIKAKAHNPKIQNEKKKNLRCKTNTWINTLQMSHWVIHGFTTLVSRQYPCKFEVNSAHSVLVYQHWSMINLNTDSRPIEYYIFFHHKFLNIVSVLILTH